MQESSRPSQRPLVQFGRGTFDVTDIENIRQILRELVTGIGEERNAAENDTPLLLRRFGAEQPGKPADDQENKT